MNAAVTSHGSSGPRIALCATGKTGLGHLRRLINIAGELVRQAPSCQLELVSNAEIAGLTGQEKSWLSATHLAERGRMADTIARIKPDLVVVDTAVIPGLHALDVPLCLVLRETIAGNAARFNLEGGRAWDRVCVPNPEDHWLPGPEVFAWSLKAVGWIYRTTGSINASNVESRKTPLVLAASGGGGNAETAAYYARSVDAVLSKARKLCPAAFEVSQVVGPRAASRDLLSNADQKAQVGSHLNEAFATADIVISTAGYNSVLELAQVSTPVLLVPIGRSHDDQLGRARYWESRMGHVHVDGLEDASARWLANEVASGRRRQPCDLGPSGAGRCAQLLLEMCSCTVA